MTPEVLINTVVLVIVVSCCEGVWEGGEESGGRVVSGGGEGLVKLWDVHEGRELLSMAGHSAEVVSLIACTHSPGSTSAYYTM